MKLLSLLVGWECLRMLWSLGLCVFVGSFVRFTACGLSNNFEIQTDHLIPSRRPDQVFINKKKLLSNGLYRYGGEQSENKRKRKHS